MTGPDESAWRLLDANAIELLRRAWSHGQRTGDMTVYRLQRDQALATAAARQRSAERADRRQLDVFNDRAARQGIGEQDRIAFTDLSDLDAATRDRLLAIRRTGDLCRYATELGMARDAAARALTGVTS